MIFLTPFFQELEKIKYFLARNVLFWSSLIEHSKNSIVLFLAGLKTEILLFLLNFGKNTESFARSLVADLNNVLHNHSEWIKIVIFTYLSIYIVISGLIKLKQWLLIRKRTSEKQLQKIDAEIEIKKTGWFSSDIFLNLFKSFKNRLAYFSVSFLNRINDKYEDSLLFSQTNQIFHFFIPAFHRTLKIYDFLVRFLEQFFISLKIIKLRIQENEILISRLKEEKTKIEIPELLLNEFNEEGEEERAALYAFPEYESINEKVATYWKNHGNASFLIIGRQGTGKTLLINAMLNKHFQSDIKQMRIVLNPSADKNEIYESLLFALTGKKTTEEALKVLTDDLPSSIIIIENLHYLFIRKDSGFQLILSFLALMEQVRKKHLWIITINEYSYRFLTQFIELGSPFEFQLKLSIFKTEDIEKLIVKKAESRGYTIHPNIDKAKIDFLKKKIKKNELKYADIPRYLISQFFGKLVSECENIFPSLYYYFLNSIVNIDQKRIYLEDTQFTDLSFLEKLKPSYFFILTAVLIHDHLSIEELQEILKMGKEELFISLVFLEEKNILKREAIHQKEFYFIDPVNINSVSKILVKKNFLYF